jgi:hypothetical protein
MKGRKRPWARAKGCSGAGGAGGGGLGLLGAFNGPCSNASAPCERCAVCDKTGVVGAEVVPTALRQWVHHGACHRALWVPEVRCQMSEARKEREAVAAEKPGYRTVGGQGVLL